MFTSSSKDISSDVFNDSAVDLKALLQEKFCLIETNTNIGTPEIPEPPEITRPFGDCGVFSNDSATAVGLMILDSFSPPNEDMSFSELWYRVSQLRFRSGEALFHVLYRCFPERVVALTHVGTDYSEPWFEAINT